MSAPEVFTNISLYPWQHKNGWKCPPKNWKWLKMLKLLGGDNVQSVCHVKHHRRTLSTRVLNVLCLQSGELKIIERVTFILLRTVFNGGVKLSFLVNMQSDLTVPSRLKQICNPPSWIYGLHVMMSSVYQNLRFNSPHKYWQNSVFLKKSPPWKVFWKLFFIFSDVKLCVGTGGPNVEKKLCFQKYPHICGQSLSCPEINRVCSFRVATVLWNWLAFSLLTFTPQPPSTIIKVNLLIITVSWPSGTTSLFPSQPHLRHTSLQSASRTAVLRLLSRTYILTPVILSEEV